MKESLMPTDKQIAANRRNAKLSTGPRTPEGKVASRLNALRTGLRLTKGMLPPESLQELNETRHRFMLLWQPQTGLERRLVAQAACAEWKLLDWQSKRTQTLIQAGEHPEPRRRSRIRADYSRRLARLEQDVREAYAELENVISLRPDPNPLVA